MAGHRQQAAERGAPAARTDDGDSHRLLRKSMITGQPSSSSLLRS